MLKKMPIRLRLTILSVLLLISCCVCLTLILNLSANQMANVIEATPISPATQIGADGLPIESESIAMGTMPATSPEGSQTARKLFLYQSIAYMVLVVVVGGALTYYISGKALRPLSELSDQMKKRTVHTLSENLPIPESHDEIADLTISLNQMSAKLDDSFAMQKRFSQSAAHELRTPLTVLKAKVDVFKKKTDHTPEEYDKLLSVITTHTNRLSNLVTDLLDLSNMDALDYHETINVKTLLIEVVEELSALAEKHTISVRVSGIEQTLTGNLSLLYRAFYNLVENAINYNHENGTVDITLSSLDEYTIITIKDSGIGIPIEMQNLIFEPFFRVDKSRSRQMGGAGLGLATVKSIIDKHNGTITLSDNLDGGTIFKITL